MTNVSTGNTFDFSEQAASEYLEQHGVPQLMVEVGACIAGKHPDDLNAFLIQEFRARLGRSHDSSMN